MFIKNRFPPFNKITPVLAWLMFIVFSYALYQFFWYIPSWLDYRSVAEILAIGSYTLALSLIESLILLGCLLLLSAFVPSRFLKDRFVSQSIVVIWVLSFWAWLIQTVLTKFPVEVYKYINQLTFGEAIIVMLIGFSAVIFSLIISHIIICRFKSLEYYLLALTEHVKFFLYIYSVLGIIGFIIVIARNIS